MKAPKDYEVVITQLIEADKAYYAERGHRLTEGLATPLPASFVRQIWRQVRLLVRKPHYRRGPTSEIVQRMSSLSKYHSIAPRTN